MKKRGRRSNAEKAAMKNKVGKVMHEFKEGDLTTHGKKVTNPKQAVAIALSEAQKMETGGEIESKISKLQKVVDSNLVPDSVKDKAKKEIERLKAEQYVEDKIESLEKSVKESTGTQKERDEKELAIFKSRKKTEEKVEEKPEQKTLEKKPKNVSTKMYVKLSSSVNPDRSRGEEGNVSIKPIKVEVSSFKEARDKALEFIDKHNLGGGNWTGGEIYQGTKQVAHVSYNGRVWEGSDAMSTTKEEIVIDEPKTPEKKEVATKKAVKKEVEDEINHYKTILKNIDHPTNKRYVKKNVEKIISELEGKLKKESPTKKTKAKPSNAPRPGQKRDLKKDAQRKALPLGKRISKNGKTYYENRLNEADTDSETKLENGGEIIKKEDLEFKKLPKETGGYYTSYKLGTIYFDEKSGNISYKTSYNKVYNATSISEAKSKIDEYTKEKQTFENGGAIEKTEPKKSTWGLSYLGNW